MVVCSALGDDQRSECAVGDFQACVDPLGAAVPDRVVMLHGDHTVVPALVKPVHQPAPVDLAEAGSAVAPPLRVGRVGAVDWAGVTAPVAAVGEYLDVFVLDMADAVELGLHRREGVDAHAGQMRWIEVEVQA